MKQLVEIEKLIKSAEAMDEILHSALDDFAQCKKVLGTLFERVQQLETSLHKLHQLRRNELQRHGIITNPRPQVGRKPNARSRERNTEG